MGTSTGGGPLVWSGWTGGAAAAAGCWAGVGVGVGAGPLVWSGPAAGAEVEVEGAGVAGAGEAGAGVLAGAGAEPDEPFAEPESELEDGS